MDVAVVEVVELETEVEIVVLVEVTLATLVP